MINITKDWYIQWPFRKPWGKWVDVEIDLGESLFKSVVESMIEKGKAITLECEYCKIKLANIAVLEQYVDFPIICTNCLVGE